MLKVDCGAQGVFFAKGGDLYDKCVTLAGPKIMRAGKGRVTEVMRAKRMVIAAGLWFSVSDIDEATIDAESRDILEALRDDSPVQA